MDRRAGRSNITREGPLFVGLDVIGDYLTEINVTAQPVCARLIVRKTPSAEKVIAAIEVALVEHRRS